MFTQEERASIIALLEKGIINEVNGKITISQIEFRWDICRFNNFFTGETRFSASIAYETMAHFDTAEEAMESLETALSGLMSCGKVIDAVLLD